MKLTLLIFLPMVAQAAPLECLKGLSGDDLGRRSQLKPGVPWTWLLETKAVADGIGKAKMGSGPVVYDVDLFDANAAQISELKAKKKVVICYVAGGSMQFDSSVTYGASGKAIPCNQRKRVLARPELTPLMADVKSNSIGGMIADWPDNCWLDPRDPSVLVSLERVALEAKKKGCDGVEFDNMDGGLDAENRAQAGFSKNANEMIQAQLTFNAKVAEMLHRHGLCAAIKNGHAFAAQQCEKFDMAVVEGIVEEGSSPGADPGSRAALDAWKRCALDRPVFAAEYPGPAKFPKYKCPTQAGNLSVNYFKNRDYVDGGVSCPGRSSSGTTSDSESMQ